MIADTYRFEGLGKINVIVGRNGCGKSRCLRRFDEVGRIDPESLIEKMYVSPERGGSVKYSAGIDENMGSADNYLSGDRRKNQASNFKPQSVSQFRRLFTKVLWKLNQSVGVASEAELVSLKFDRYVEDINSLLDQIEIEPNDTVFEIRNKTTGQRLQAEQVSSGESELITLSIEVLAFEALKCGGAETPIRLLDEPDVHLHPDLQMRLVKFLRKVCDRSNLRIILSTHSSPVLSALADYEHARLFFMKFGDTQVRFSPISEAVKAMLPVFGAHPLTAVFNEAPLFLVEGTDEDRIWQQSVRTSQGRIKVFPVVSGDVDSLTEYENHANAILGSVYDTATAYSLRDGDEICTDIDNLERVVRFRLHCYSSENLMLTDEVLATAGKTWGGVKAQADAWISNNNSHQYHAEMLAFQQGGYDRRCHRLKEIRNILASFISNKAWEVVIGQTVGRLTLREGQGFDDSGSIFSFIGEKMCKRILPRS